MDRGLSPSSSRLISAAKKGDPSLVADLLKQGCSADERDKNGSTALMHAIWHATPGTGYFDVVELLVEAGADVNSQNVRLNTALHFAYERNNTALVEFLLQNGATASQGKKNALGLLPKQLQPHHHPIKQYIGTLLPRPDLPDTVSPLPQPIITSRRYLNRTFTSSSDGFSLADVFNAADTDCDGLISTSEELRVALHAIGLAWTHTMQAKFQYGGLKSLRLSLMRGSSIGDVLSSSLSKSSASDDAAGVPETTTPGSATAGSSSKPALHPGSPTASSASRRDSELGWPLDVPPSLPSSPGLPRTLRLTSALSSPTIRTSSLRDGSSIDLNMFCRIVSVLQQLKQQSLESPPSLVSRTASEGSSGGAKAYSRRSFAASRSSSRAFNAATHASPRDWVGEGDGSTGSLPPRRQSYSGPSHLPPSATRRSPAVVPTVSTRVAADKSRPSRSDCDSDGRAPSAHTDEEDGNGYVAVEDEDDLLPASKSCESDSSGGAFAGDSRSPAGGESGGGGGGDASSDRVSASLSDGDVVPPPRLPVHGLPRRSFGRPKGKHQREQELDAPPAVFLGGACNPTTWRTDVAIPMLTAADVTFYNPQVASWTPDLVDTEAEAKARATVILFVVDDKTRGVASMVEASETVASRRNVVLVLRDIPVDGLINGTVIPLDELRDLNRGRAYLADVASRHGCPVFQTVEAGVEEVLRRLGVASGGPDSSGESSP